MNAWTMRLIQRSLRIDYFVVVPLKLYDFRQKSPQKAVQHKTYDTTEAQNNMRT